MDTDFQSRMLSALFLGIPALIIASAVILDPDLVYKNSGQKLYRTDEEIERIYNRTTENQKRVRISLLVVPMVLMMLGSIIWRPMSVAMILFWVFVVLVKIGLKIKSWLSP